MRQANDRNDHRGATRRIALTALACAVATAAGCHRCPGPSSVGEERPRPSPAAEGTASSTTSHQRASVPVGEPDEPVREALCITLWSADLDHPISLVHVTPEGNVVAIGPRRLTVFDSRGRHRWYRNLAPGDEVIPSARCLFVRTADHRLLMALNHRGGNRWERELEGTFSSLANGTLLAADAAAVRAVECRRGRERWMFSPDHQRSLRLLHVGPESLTLIGEIGEQRLLFSLSLEGDLLATRELPPATQDAQLTDSGWILSRTATTLTVIDEVGAALWTQPVTARTEVASYRGDVVLAKGSPDGHVDVRVLDRSGEIKHSYHFDAGAEPVSLRILGSDQVPLLVAGCTGALRSCAERGLSPGPYNRLWGFGDEGRVTSMMDEQEETYFNIAQSGPTTMVVASTATGGTTRVVRIDTSLRRTTVARLSGRRMVGPVPGPSDSWLVSTCQGRGCEQPWRLYAIADQADK